MILRHQKDNACVFGESNCLERVLVTGFAPVFSRMISAPAIRVYPRPFAVDPTPPENPRLSPAFPRIPPRDLNRPRCPRRR
jgi:hypothetical protein